MQDREEPDPEPVTEPAAARVRGLDARFANGTHALRRVDLELRRGEILGLVGESGSGKTLLGLSLLGLAPEEAELTGEASLGATEMVTATAEERRLARRERAGAVFQDPMTSLNPTMKVGRQVAEAAGSVDKAEELLGQVGIPDPDRRIGQYPHELSGGLRQRVMIAMAIARSPSVIILDEPTTALDVTLQRGILALLSGLRDELGAAMLLITHDLAVAAEVADRVAVMYAGRVAEIGDSERSLPPPLSPLHLGAAELAPRARRAGRGRGRGDASGRAARPARAAARMPVRAPLLVLGARLRRGASAPGHGAAPPRPRRLHSLGGDRRSARARQRLAGGGRDRASNEQPATTRPTAPPPRSI